MRSKVFLNSLYENNRKQGMHYPTKEMAHGFINLLSELLFPVRNEHSMDLNEIEKKWDNLKCVLKDLLLGIKLVLENNVDDIVEEYFDLIPEIFDKLMLDAVAINEFDPAAYSVEEVVLTYPGFHAIMIHRLAFPLYQMNVPVLPRLFSEYAHTNTGIDINPGAKIGESFFIDHGTGIVIGETTVIGRNVKIYQGVTLGALNVRKSESKIKRHPTIEDNVIIYSGTTVLGGNTIIGHDSIVGGNVWLTKSLKPNSLVYNKSEIRVRNGNEKYKEPVNLTI